MKGRKSERLEKRAAALRDNLRRRKPKSGQSGEESPNAASKPSKKPRKSEE